ncbi:hypothetical protein PFICI_03068 [Pestalotiopsis fici W106-1]|uniref:N-acetyltransferase domain-containing protein n=1 Tax=Pestalotiopsis fici (strain W106-1 / CGMCC3.15140) TaxID=1229662 RepID=W3XG18_PESFW|nr:uncharacterized protein PFICI_03068 [Pestalotiopsis fici W106-1]ETS85043.1 hypothetical protein PFICI_03068 [Pestalotiopsis fici W106-1]
MALPFATPASLSPSFVLSYCEAGDVDQLCNVYYEAFKEDPGNSHWWSPSRDKMMAWMRTRIEKKMADRSIRHFKVTDVASGDMVAFARWDIPEGSEHFGGWLGDCSSSNSSSGNDGAAVAAAAAVNVTKIVESEPSPQDAEQESQEVAASAPSVEQQVVDVPEGADPFLALNFFGALKKASAQWYKSDMLGLSLISTDPKYHRRGAAKALIVPMLELADSHGITAYLEATPAGKPVYEKLGFRQVDSLDFNLQELTKGNLDGWYRLSIMTREPRAKPQ